LKQRKVSCHHKISKDTCAYEAHIQCRGDTSTFHCFANELKQRKVSCHHKISTSTKFHLTLTKGTSNAVVTRALFTASQMVLIFWLDFRGMAPMGRISVTPQTGGDICVAGAEPCPEGQCRGCSDPQPTAEHRSNNTCEEQSPQRLQGRSKSRGKLLLTEGTSAGNHCLVSSHRQSQHALHTRKQVRVCLSVACVPVVYHEHARPSRLLNTSTLSACMLAPHSKKCRVCPHPLKKRPEPWMSQERRAWHRVPARDPETRSTRP
jgi:hypothetical protein